ncbi:MAG: cell division protein FtsA [Phocaeicola sp.]
MEATEFIVAIELGSSKMIGIAGKNLPDGTVQVLAVSGRESSSFIRKGRIYNLDKTAHNLTLIIKELEEKLQATINKVYVGIGGQSLQSLFNSEVDRFDEETKVSQDLINVLIDRNIATPILDKEILDVIPQEYKLGLNYLVDPVGVPCTRLEGNFLNIVARNSLKQNIDTCFRQARIKIADYAISPLVLADAVLTPNEKRSGCALVDFGADTTTVCLFKNNILRHLAVIPLGGRTITTDISSQKFEEEDAERLKLLYADAYTTPAAGGENDSLSYVLDGKRTIAVQLFNEIVEGRVNEILMNVVKQIELSGYRDKLLEGVVFTGGAAALKNITLAFQQLSKIEKVRVENKTQLHVDYLPTVDKSELSTLSLAIVHWGKENCCKPEVKITVPEVKEVKKVEKSPEVIVPKPEQGTLFTDEEKSTDEGKSVDKIEVRSGDPVAVVAPTPVSVPPPPPVQSDVEDAKIQLHHCELLVRKAVLKKQNGQFKEALKEFEEALALNVPEKKMIIEQHIAEINQLTKDRGFFGMLKKKINRWSESMTEEY